MGNCNHKNIPVRFGQRPCPLGSTLAYKYKPNSKCKVDRCGHCPNYEPRGQEQWDIPYRLWGEPTTKEMRPCA